MHRQGGEWDAWMHKEFIALKHLFYISIQFAASISAVQMLLFSAWTTAFVAWAFTRFHRENALNSKLQGLPAHENKMIFKTE